MQKQVAMQLKTSARCADDDCLRTCGLAERVFDPAARINLFDIINFERMIININYKNLLYNIYPIEC